MIEVKPLAEIAYKLDTFSVFTVLVLVYACSCPLVELTLHFYTVFGKIDECLDDVV